MKFPKYKWITNQDKLWQDSAHIAEEMDTPLCTAESKPTMMRLKDYRHGTTKSVEQFSLMITIKEEDLTLDLRTLRILISNPETEIKTIRHPIYKLFSIHIRTEIQTQIDSITNAELATPVKTDQINDSRLTITATLDQRVVTPDSKKLSTEQQSTYTQLSSIYWRSGTRCSKYPIRLLSFKLLKSPRPDEESNFKSRFHMNALYFPTRDSQKDSGLEIEFMLDTGAACSIKNFRTFLETGQFRQPITVVKIKQKTKT